MAKKGKQKVFRSTTEVFSEYIPGYIPPCPRQSKINSSDEDRCKNIAEDLLTSLKRKICLK